MNYKPLNQSLYIKLLFILLTLGLFPIVALSIVGYNFFSTIMFEMVAESNYQTLRQVEYKLEKTFRDIDEILMKTSAQEDIQKVLKEERLNDWKSLSDANFYVNYTRLLMVGHPEIYKISLFDQEGNPMDSRGRYLKTNHLLLPSVYKDIQDSLRGHKSNKNRVVSRIYKDQGKHLMAFGKLVLDLQTGNPIGVIIVDLDMDVLRDELSSVTLSSSGSIVLVSKDNQILYHPEIGPGNMLNEPWTNFQGSYILIENSMGKKQLLLKSTINSNLDERMIYGIIPYEELTKKIENTRTYFLFFFFLMLIAIATTAVLMKRLFVKPIRKLQILMRNVEKGRFTVRSNFKRNDELGQLGKSFNKMIEQIEKLINEVYEVKLNESRALVFQKQAELQALQARITPHFLYNTLNSVSWFADRRGIREIQLIIDSLSNMLRYSVETSSQMVTLKDEIFYLKLYAEIINFRYDVGIHFSYILPDDLENAKIPRLTLQPLAENAVKYAFETMEGNNHILIKAYLAEDKVIVEVTDNGMGIEHSELQGLSNRLAKYEIDNLNMVQGGMGLINVNQRLKLWFGKKYGLQIESVSGKGTKVIITFPFKTEFKELS